jgi:cardiolipin synthase
MTLPNIISCIRILFVFIFCILYFNPITRPISFWIIILSGSSDLLDGYIARHFNQISNLGKVLDPIADKLFHISTIICFYLSGIIDLWLVIIIFIKEAFMVIGGIVLYNKTHAVIPSKWYGKLSSCLFFTAFMIAFYIQSDSVLNSVERVTVTLFFLLAIIVSIYAMINYVITAVKINRNVKVGNIGKKVLQRQESE